MNKEQGTKKGKFIVIYGVNNLGKSTQAKLLVERLQKEGHRAEYLKYPVYDIEPSGKLINNYLREGNTYNLNHREAQIIYALNRTQNESILKQKLNQGITIIGEDYTGSGLSWGIGRGVDPVFMKYINSHLLVEDMAFVFDGNRFVEATEETHINETNHSLQEEVRKVYMKIGSELNWIPINANQSIETIHKEVWSHVFPLFSS